MQRTERWHGPPCPASLGALTAAVAAAAYRRWWTRIECPTRTESMPLRLTAC